MKSCFVHSHNITAGEDKPRCCPCCTIFGQGRLTTASFNIQLAPRGPRFDRAPRGEGESTPRAHGTRGARGARGGRGGARHGGFDRHSGTGIVDSEKKEHNRLGNATTAPLEGEKDAQE